MRKIPIFNRKTKGLYFIVDDEDYEKLSSTSWHLSKGYANCSMKLNNKYANMGAHRIIMGTENYTRSKGIIDHINHNILDNRKRNLRIVTQSENYLNPDIKKKLNRKGYRWSKKDKAYQARITINQQQKHIGNYHTEKEAKDAYIRKVLSLI